MTAALSLILALAALIAGYRVARGPSLADRVVALDVVAATAVGLLVVYAARLGQPVLLDAAIALALVSFVGTVAFAAYLERRVRS